MSADNWCECPKCGKDFREDYGLGIHDAKFYVDYSGQCVDGCGFAISYKIEKPVDQVRKK